MKSPADSAESKELRIIFVAILLLVLVFVAATILLLPSIIAYVDLAFSPGIGLKQGAIISFFVTAITVIALAIFAGDGIIGEIQFMLAAFGSFFIVIWFLIAWVF